jgi:hypothetical protein
MKVHGLAFGNSHQEHHSIVVAIVVFGQKQEE